MIKITYDKTADAAYIYLLENPKPGWAIKTHPVEGIDCMINLDFDEEGKLGGIEVLDASKVLPKALLQKAEV